MATAKKSETTDATRDQQNPTMEQFAETFEHLQADGLGGFESMTSDVIAFPFIKVLQQLSPQLNSRKPEFVEGAKQGMLYNNITNAVYEPPVEVVVGRFDHYFIEWRPERGGFCGAHAPDDISARLAQGLLVRNDRNQIIDPGTKNIFSETYVYYVIFPNDVSQGVCLLSLSSTQLKEARRWNRLLLSTYIPGTNRRAQPYFLRWNVTTPLMSNDKGDWCGLRVDFAGFVGPETLQLVADERKALPQAKPDMALIALNAGESQEGAYEITPEDGKF